VTTLATISLTDTKTGYIRVQVVARDTGGNYHNVYVREAGVYRDGGGAVRIKNFGSPFTREERGSWQVYINVSGNNALIQVKGEAATTVDWEGWYWYNEAA